MSIQVAAFEPEVILLAVGWYLRFSLSYRDVEELLAERGLSVDHVTVWRWVQRYAPEIQRRLRPRLRPTNDSWRVDETYIRVKGKWVYLYRAVDSIRRRGSSTPTSTPVIHRPSCGSKPRRLWRRIAGIDRCSTSIMFWNRITGRSNAGCAQASIFVHSGELGARSPATKRFI